jgi:hypothetical protein
VCFALFACSYGDRRSHPLDDPDPPSTEILRGTIDTDAALEVEPGRGAGVFVEYQSGGRWHVYTACDSELSDAYCVFDVLVNPVGSATVLGISPENLEGDDLLAVSGKDEVNLIAYTDYGLDGFWLETEPGAVLSIDVLLDDQDGNRWVDWVGDGAVHKGAPSIPFEFEPSVP